MLFATWLAGTAALAAVMYVQLLPAHHAYTDRHPETVVTAVDRVAAFVALMFWSALFITPVVAIGWIAR